MQDWFKAPLMAVIFGVGSLILPACGGDGGGCGDYCDVVDKLEGITAAETCDEGDLDCIEFSRIETTLANNPTACDGGVVLALAHKRLEEDEAEDAKDLLLEAELLKTDCVPETYTFIVSSIKVAVDNLAPLLDFVLGAPSAGLIPEATDLRPTLRQLLKPITSEFEDIEEYTPLIHDTGTPVVNIPSLPIDFDLSLISEDIPSDLEVDLGGIWGFAELKLLGAASGALLGGVDFILAHNLAIDIGSILVETSQDVANLIIDNGDALKMDDPDLVTKSAKDRFVTALDYVAGTGNGDSLLDIIETELGTDQSEDVIQFIDDGDGKVSEGDKVNIPVVAELAEQVGDENGDGEDDLVPSDSEITNEIGREAWAAVVDLGVEFAKAMRAGENAELIHLAEYLSGKVAGNGEKRLWEELQEEEADVDDIADWIQLDSGEYFVNPVGLRNLLPAVSALEASEGTIYDLALECELGYTAEEWATPDEDGLAEDSVIRAICGDSGEGSTGMQLKQIWFTDSATSDTNSAMVDGLGFDDGSTVEDFKNFLGLITDGTPSARAITEAAALADPIGVIGAHARSAMSFAKDLNPPAGDVELSPDGYVVSDWNADDDPYDVIYLAVLMQNPSLGGTLHLDIDGDGVDGAEATNDTLHQLMSLIWQRYGDDLTDAFSDDDE